MKVNTLKLIDPNFPKILSQIPSPPEQIYWVGRDPEQWLDKPKVAIVGSRKLTAYGKAVTARLASELAQRGVVIISGLAYGIDITAHLATLSVGGTTVSVLPSGLDQIYPPAHANIARKIVQQGTLISEYLSETITFKTNFIARNRLVSGLSDVLLITEAAVNSGSLHTARFALEQGKTVMAVPGNITSPTSEGCNNLVKSGALPVTDINDILFALKLNPAKQAPKTLAGDKQEQLIYKLIQNGVNDQEELAVSSKMGIPAVSSALTMLEISGYIRPAGGGSWIIA